MREDSYAGVLAIRKGNETQIAPELKSHLLPQLPQVPWVQLCHTIEDMIKASEQQRTIRLEDEEVSITIIGASASNLLGRNWHFEGEISITSSGEK